MRARFAVGLVLVAVAGLIWGAARAEDPVPDKPVKQVTLLGTLQEWMYPESTFGGASISDGGNRTIFSANCQAVLKTGDSVEKVAKYYTEKFISGPDQPGGVVAVAQSVAEQDDSEGRPVKLRVITVNRAESSTTLVISRAKGEEKTHIAWSHYLRMGDVPVPAGE